MIFKGGIYTLFLIANIAYAHTTQRPSRDSAAASDDSDGDSNPLIDMASAFIQEAISNQGGGGNGGASSMTGIASLVGSFMQSGGSSGKSMNSAAVTQILSGLGGLLMNSQGQNDAGGGSGGGGGGGGGSSNGAFNPALIANIVEMFTANSDDDNSINHGESRSIPNSKKTDSSLDNIQAILQVASTFMNSMNFQQQQQQQHQHEHQPQQQTQYSKSGKTNNPSKQNQKQHQPQQPDNGLASLLPLIMQVVSSFTGPEGQKTQEKHRDHAWVLPPFLEQIHVLWDHFSNSELAEALWQKSGVYTIFKGFTGRDGKLDYDRLFDSLNNQAFRRRWIKATTLYLADWANYIANPDVYQRYIQSAQIMFNGLLKSQSFPKSTYFDPTRPSETISNLLDYIAKIHLNVKVDSRTYVKPAVNYARELLKLGQARGLLQQFNATDLSDKLTDMVNLEVIEPILKVHRAYRFAASNPHCDKYVLCQLNSHDPNEELGLPGFKPGAIKFGSMASAWFISSETGTPFWTLFAVINDPYNCEARFPVDCSGFHEGEAKVTTEYFHNEL